MVGVQAGQERSKNGWSDKFWFVCIMLASHIWSAERLDGDDLSMHGWHLTCFVLMPCEPSISKCNFQNDTRVISPTNSVIQRNQWDFKLWECPACFVM